MKILSVLINERVFYVHSWRMCACVSALHVKYSYTERKRKEKPTLTRVQAALKFTQSGIGFYWLKVMTASLFNFTDLECRGSPDPRVTLLNVKFHSCFQQCVEDHASLSLSLTQSSHTQALTKLQSKASPQVVLINPHRRTCTHAGRGNVEHFGPPARIWLDSRLLFCLWRVSRVLSLLGNPAFCFFSFFFFFPLSCLLWSINLSGSIYFTPQTCASFDLPCCPNLLRSISFTVWSIVCTEQSSPAQLAVLQTSVCKTFWCALRDHPNF